MDATIKPINIKELLDKAQSLHGKGKYDVIEMNVEDLILENELDKFNLNLSNVNMGDVDIANMIARILVRLGADRDRVSFTYNAPCDGELILAAVKRVKRESAQFKTEGKYTLYDQVEDEENEDDDWEYSSPTSWHRYHGETDEDYQERMEDQESWLESFDD